MEVENEYEAEVYTNVDADVGIDIDTDADMDVDVDTGVDRETAAFRKDGAAAHSVGSCAGKQPCGGS